MMMFFVVNFDENTTLLLVFLVMMEVQLSISLSPGDQSQRQVKKV